MRGAPLIQFQSDDRPEIRLQKLRRLAEAVAAIDLTSTTVTPTPDPTGITMTGPAVLGRLSGTGEPLSLTGAQVTTILSIFSPANKGVVPAPGTATGNRFLRDDGGWSTVTIAAGSVLHADLAGLSADDHTQYVLRSILTADGDLFTRAGGIVDRLAIGTEAQLLRSISGAPSWQTVSPILTLGTDLSGNTTFTDLGNATLNATIVNNAVTDAKLRDSAGLSVIGRSVNSTGDPADISGTADQVLRINTAGNALAFGTVATAGLADDAVTNAKLASMVQATIKGRADAAGIGDPTDLTGAQVATIIGYTAADVLTKLLTVDGAGSLLDADLLDGVQGSDYARISVANTFLAAQTISAGSPFQIWLESDQSSDEQLWAWSAASKVFSLKSFTAGFAISRQQLAFTRGTGAAVTTIDVGNTSDNAAVNFLGTGAIAIGGALSVTGTVTVPNTSFTYAKIQDVSATSRVLGRISSGSGVIEELTAANLATIVNATLDHGTLLGLADDDHPQYGAIAQNEAITGAWNFTTFQQAFGVTTANLALVPGLADTDASLHAARFVRIHRVAGDPFIQIARVNGSYASPTAIVSGNSLGEFNFGGYDGSTIQSQSCRLFYEARENWSGSARGGSLRFQTTTEGTTTRQDRLFLAANSTGAFALLPSGVAAQPGWAFLSDTDTGIYLVGANSMGLSTSGTLRVTLNTVTLTSTLPFLGPDGSAGTPTYGWSSDTNTGLYWVGADNMGISTGGTSRWDISTTAVTSTLPLKGPDGSAAATSYGFSAEATLGMYRIGTNILGLSTASTERLRIDASGAWGLAGANVGTAGQTLTSNGSGAAPTWQNATTFSGASNTSIPAGNTVANTASETALTSSYTIPANSLRAGSVISIKLFGTYGTDAVLAPTLQGRLKIGGTTRLDTGSLTAVVGATNRGWTAEGQIVVHSIGAGGVADAQGTAQFSTAVTAALAVHMPNTATFTLDTTTTQAITITIQWGTADTDNTITLRQFVVSISNP